MPCDACYRNLQGKRKKDSRPLTANIQREPGATDAALEADTIRDAVLTSLEDDKAEDVLLLDLEGKSTIADHMIIASGRSGRHVAALAEHVQRKIKELGGQRARVEGLPNADWVLIDTGDLIVHLFRPEVRDFYDLERIWAGPAGQGHLRH
ncbi:MAG: ribosome silencing factor [Pseudomonadota bacterium]